MRGASDPCPHRRSRTQGLPPRGRRPLPEEAPPAMGRPVPSRAAARLPESIPGPPFMAFDPKFIRNFSIIAHIDHGKSTLADRLLLNSRARSASARCREQLLDDMDLERERGITIKARAVAMQLHATRAQTYELNLIDTPGHVDFHYEVSRSLACCEGAVLLVDAFQGVEGPDRGQRLRGDGARPDDRAGAQQDRPAGTPGPTKSCDEMEHVARRSIPTRSSRVSGKTGVGVEELLAGDHRARPAARRAIPTRPLQAMVFDSHYDDYRGAITYVRVDEWHASARARRSASCRPAPTHEVLELGQFRPARVACDELAAGQVGYLICNIKSLGDVHIGDTVTDARRRRRRGAAGLSRAASGWSICGLYPVRRTRLRRAARRARQARDQRPQLRVRARDERRPGLRLPLRLPRPAAHGDHPAAARAESRPRPGADRAERHLRDPHHATARRCRSTSRRKCPTRARSRSSASRSSGSTSSCRPSTSAPIMKLCTDRRGDLRADRVPLADPGDAHLRPAAGRSDLRHARQAQERHPRLRHDGLRADRLPRRPTWCGSTSWSTASGSTPCRSSATAATPTAAAAASSRSSSSEIDRHMFEVAIQAAIGSRDHRPRNDLRDAQERHRQVLRRRHHPQAQALESRRKARSG